MDKNQTLRVLFIAAEADPFVKVGGLADVAGSLPLALRTLHQTPSLLHPQESGEGFIDIRLAIPYHGAIREDAYDLRPVTKFSVPNIQGSIPAEAFSTNSGDLPVYLIAGDPISPDAPVYSADSSADGHKYTFFALAALELARAIGWSPHILHANDWHTSAAVYSLARKRPTDLFYRNTASLLSLHNLPYLGVDSGPALKSYMLPPAHDSRLPKWAQHMALPLGLLAADHIVAVSPGYAKEILTPEFGSGLHEFLRTRVDSLSGILNGIDVKRWDPETDPHLEANYSIHNLAPRAVNKNALQRELGFEPDPNKPLLAMITRMDYQKGVDLTLEALRQLFLAADSGQGLQAVLLGTGNPELEESARRLEINFPDRVHTATRYDPALSRRIYAGVDALLIPSRYEPCGLAQMIAMRYGCVPIARATGGLIDTIRDYGATEESTGFLFHEAEPEALEQAVMRAMTVFAHPERWQALQLRGMREDFSWERSARVYLELYHSLVKRRSGDENQKTT